MPDYPLRFGIKIYKMFKSQWSIGACISHNFGETYIFINLLKYDISIGFMRLEKFIQTDF